MTRTITLNDEQIITLMSALRHAMDSYQDASQTRDEARADELQISIRQQLNGQQGQGLADTAAVAITELLDYEADSLPTGESFGAEVYERLRGVRSALRAQVAMVS